MARLGCLWLSVVLLLIPLALLSSCATQFRCHFVYDDVARKHLSCDVESPDQPPEEPLPSETTDEYPFVVD